MERVQTVHYYTEVGSKTIKKAPGSTPNVSFPDDDGRVYSVSMVAGKIIIKSTPEGQSNWLTNYTWGGTQRFEIMSYEYKNGKIHIVAVEDKNNDSQSLRYIVLKVGGSGSVNKVPTVNLTTPANNTTYAAPATISIAATASDADVTIAWVVFYNGATLKDNKGAVTTSVDQF